MAFVAGDYILYRGPHVDDSGITGPPVICDVKPVVVVEDSSVAWRTRRGFDTGDLQLDILVAPDRTWRWKDEDDFARSIECGLISAANAEATRASAGEAIAAIEAGAGPFDDSAAQWRPPPEWQIPQLPAGEELEDVLRWSERDSLGRF